MTQVPDRARPWILRVLSAGVFAAFALPFATLVFVMSDCGTSSSGAALNVDPSESTKRPVRREDRTGYGLVALDRGEWLLIPLGISGMVFLLSWLTGLWSRTGPFLKLGLRTAAGTAIGLAGFVLSFWTPSAPMSMDVKVVPRVGYWLAAACLGLLTVFVSALVVGEYSRLWRAAPRSRWGRGLIVTAIVLAHVVIVAPLVFFAAVAYGKVKGAEFAGLVLLVGHLVLFLLLPAALVLTAPLGLVGAGILRRATMRAAST